MIYLTRRYHFSASHRLHVTGLSEAENARLFGKCNNPFGHGHNYVLGVTVCGPVNLESGLILETRELDRMVEENVLRIFAHRNLNRDLPQFAELIPTTENVVLAIANILEANWLSWFGEKSTARLAKVHVQETDRNGFEINLRSRQGEIVAVSGRESVTVSG
jgi:6-pyruvoyltetrahydropterin/6-carboxytetrahydropterin synthase